MIATKGNRAFVIEDINLSAAPVPLVERMARQQHAALSAPGRATALPAPGRVTVQASAERITSYHAGIAIQRDATFRRSPVAARRVSGRTELAAGCGTLISCLVPPGEW